MSKYDLSTPAAVEQAAELAMEHAGDEPNQDSYNAAWLHGYARALQEVAEQQKEQAPLKAFVLTCIHDTRSGASVYTSVHPSRDAADRHIAEVMAECDFDPDNERLNELYREYFDSTITEAILDPVLFSRIVAAEEQMVKDMDGDTASLEDKIASAQSQRDEDMPENDPPVSRDVDRQ